MKTQVIWILAVLLLGIERSGLVHSDSSCAAEIQENPAQQCSRNSRNHSTVVVAQLLAFEANVALPCSDKCFIDYTLLLNTDKARASRSKKQAITSGYNMQFLQHMPKQQHTTVLEANYPPAAISLVVACYDPSCTAAPSSFAILQHQFIKVAVQAPTLHQLTAAPSESPSNVWFYGFDDLPDDSDSMAIEITHKPVPNPHKIQTDNLPVSLNHTTLEASKPPNTYTHKENPATTMAQETGKVGKSAPMCYTNSVSLWGARAMLLAWLGAVEYGRRRWRLKAASATAGRS